MFGAFRPTSSLSGGLLWKIPWRLSPPQKLRHRRRLRRVDNVVSVLDSALQRQAQSSSSATSAISKASTSKAGASNATPEELSTTAQGQKLLNREANESLNEQRHGRGPRQGDILSGSLPDGRARLLGDEARRTGTIKLIERWKNEMPTEAEMLPRDKYSMFDRKAKGYRKGVHRRLSYLAVFIVFLYTWTRWNAQSRNALNHGWDLTVQKFGQGSSFAQDSAYAPTDIALAEPGEPKTAATRTLEISSSSSSPRQTISSIPQQTDLAVVSTASKPETFAYVFYATQNLYACSVLVNIERLQTLLKTKHRIFVLVTPEVSEDYIDAFELRNVTVSVQDAPPIADGGAFYYQDSLLKLYGFRMHEIDPSLTRVIVMDSDQLVLRNLDRLFEGIEVDLAAPRAY
ncbi:hypothetical protein MBLNU459_g4298t1 [Dothideomycetes sp. NU459]